MNMNQHRLNQLIELEANFKKLAELGHPNVMDTGFFLDAVFNVIAALKVRCQHSCDSDCSDTDIDVEVVKNLYRSLKEFESLYTSCLGK